MKYAERSKLPRGLRWDAKSPLICFSWRDERGSQHQQSTHTADPAEVMAFKLRFLREKQDVVEVCKVRSMDQSRLALASAADLYFAWKSATNSPGTIGREKAHVQAGREVHWSEDATPLDRRITDPGVSAAAAKADQSDDAKSGFGTQCEL
jgi:hypothetical protein